MKSFKIFLENDDKENELRLERKKYIILQNDVEEYFENLGYDLECKFNYGKTKLDTFLICPIDFGYWKCSFDIIQTRDGWFGAYESETSTSIGGFQQTIRALIMETIIELCRSSKFDFEKSLLLHLFGTHSNRHCNFQTLDLTAIFKASLRGAKLKVVETHSYKQLPFGINSIICFSMNNKFTVYEE